MFTSNELISLTDTLTLDPNISNNILHDVIQNAKNKHMPSNGLHKE